MYTNGIRPHVRARAGHTLTYNIQRTSPRLLKLKYRGGRGAPMALAHSGRIHVERTDGEAIVRACSVFVGMAIE